MHGVWTRACLYLVGVMVTGTFVAVPEVASAGGRCTGTWTIQSVPLPGGGGQLNDVDATSSGDVWAVGWWATGFYYQPLIEHSDGTSWQFMDVPTNPKRDIILNGVSALSPTDVWAVGYMNLGSSLTVAYHWNGLSWQRVPTKNPSDSNLLFSVKAIAADDVWAVGAATHSTQTTLTEHWDGISWQSVRTPDVSTAPILLGVDALASNDVWTAGYRSSPSGQALAEHWDGSAWTKIQVPTPGRHGWIFNDLSANTTSDVWAVGNADSRTFTSHSDGNRWSTVGSPSQGDQLNMLESVSASSLTNAWAAGWYYLIGAVSQTLTLRWDGASWSIISSPNLGDASALYGTVSVSEAEAYAVGYGIVEGSYQPLVEYFC